MSYKKIISAVMTVCTAFSAVIFADCGLPKKIGVDYAITADSAFMSGRIYNQWNSKWRAVTFNKYSYTANSLQESGCGVFAFCNALYALNGTIADPVEVATWAVNIGALQPGNGGTYRYPFYDNVQSAYGNRFGFAVYGYAGGGVSDSRLISHLMSGGVAVVNVPGHFMAITGYNPSNRTYHVIESAVSITRGMSPDSWVPAEKMSSGNTAVSWYALLGNSGTNNRVPTAPESRGYKLENFGDVFLARIKNPSTERYVTNINGNVGGRIAEVSDNQLWEFHMQSDGSYKIISTVDNSVMSVSNADVITSADSYLTSQRFHIYGNSGKYYIKPVSTDPFINMAAGSGNVEISINPADLPPQEFEIVKVDFEELLPVNIGRSFSAKIKNQTDGFYLTNVGGNVTAEGFEHNGSSQLWDFQLQSDGSYTITNCADRSCISVENYDNAGDGANLQTAVSDNGNSQKYYLYEAYGAYYMRSFGSDLYVNVTETTGNANAKGYVTNWSPQKFMIEKVIKGDLNSDGKVNSVDATLLKDWLMGRNVNISVQNADLTGDGNVDSFDLAVFKKIIVEERFMQIKHDLINIYINHR